MHPLLRLVVLDDVWTQAHVQPFEDLLAGGTTLLLTTRNSDLAHDFAREGGVLAVEKMAEAQALALLGNHLGRDLSADENAKALVKQCYCLPIAVRAIAALLNRGSTKARVKKPKENDTRAQQSTNLKNALNVTK